MVETDDSAEPADAQPAAMLKVSSAKAQRRMMLRRYNESPGSNLLKRRTPAPRSQRKRDHKCRTTSAERQICTTPLTYARSVNDGGNRAIGALRLVEAAGFKVALVGGWSRELLGLEPPRPHSDVDLVVTDADLTDLDRWLTSKDEIVAKRFPHKRAFRLDGTMVELHLVTRRTE